MSKLCSICKVGKLTIHQLSLSESITLCDNDDCSFFFDTTPDALIVKNPIDVEPTQNDIQSRSISRSSSNDRSSLISHTSNSDKELRRFIGKSHKSKKISKRKEYFACKSSAGSEISRSNYSSQLLDKSKCSKDLKKNTEFKKHSDQVNVNSNCSFVNPVVPKSASSNPSYNTDLDGWLDEVLQNPPKSEVSKGSNEFQNFLQVSDSVNLDRENLKKNSNPNGNDCFLSDSQSILNFSPVDSQFLSPVGSGVSEDSGFNEDELSKLANCLQREILVNSSGNRNQHLYQTNMNNKNIKNVDSNPYTPEIEQSTHKFNSPSDTDILKDLNISESWNDQAPQSYFNNSSQNLISNSNCIENPVIDSIKNDANNSSSLNAMSGQETFSTSFLDEILLDKPLVSNNLSCTQNSIVDNKLPEEILPQNILENNQTSLGESSSSKKHIEQCVKIENVLPYENSTENSNLLNENLELIDQNPSYPNPSLLTDNINNRNLDSPNVPSTSICDQENTEGSETSAESSVSSDLFQNYYDYRSQFSDKPEVAVFPTSDSENGTQKRLPKRNKTAKNTAKRQKLQVEPVRKSKRALKVNKQVIKQEIEEDTFAEEEQGYENPTSPNHVRKSLKALLPTSAVKFSPSKPNLCTKSPAFRNLVIASYKDTMKFYKHITS